MGDNKNKKFIYIGIITLCIGVTVYVMFFFNGGGGENALIEDINQPLNTSTKAPGTAANVDIITKEFAAPPVFPAQNKFSTAPLDTNIITSLNPYERLTITAEELQREDPFARF